MPTRVSLGADVHDEIFVAEEFLDWLTPDRHADLLDGEIAMHSPVSLRHARLLNFVDSLVRIHVERLDLGMVFREVVAVRLSSRNVFLPDLAFYRKDRLGLQQDSYIDGAPDLAVEVLNPRTAHRDVGVKFVEYEEHGVREYWVLDPETLGAPLLRTPRRGAHRIRRRRTGDPLSRCCPACPCAASGSPPINRRKWKTAWLAEVRRIDPRGIEGGVNRAIDVFALRGRLRDIPCTDAAGLHWRKHLSARSARHVIHRFGSPGAPAISS